MNVIRETFRSVIESEQAALAALLARNDESSVAAVELLQNCRGKVILSGVGKSGQIAAKVASTMTSTGTVALFLHPTDAVHGDLGIVSSQDVLVAFGKSGESTELVQLLPFFKRLGVKIIAITGAPKSTLGRAAEVVLDLGPLQEAGPGQIVPTASTAAMLALGDALAISLMRLRGFEPKDFAKFHPGGQLGERLLRSVAELMVPVADLRAQSEKTSLQETVLALCENGLGVACFVNPQGQLIGIFTDGDLRRRLSSDGALSLHAKADEFMNRAPTTVSPGASGAEALRTMEDRETPLNVVPVVENGKLLGVLRLHDILRPGQTEKGGHA